MSWPDRERYSCALRCLVVCILLPLVSTLVFSRTGSVLSHLNSLTHRFPPVSTAELVLPCHARCALSRRCCNGHSLLLSGNLTRIGRIENPSCSAWRHPPMTPLIPFCTVQVRTLCTSRFLVPLCLSTSSGPGSGEFPGF